jgi:hypothetical protein
MAAAAKAAQEEAKRKAKGRVKTEGTSVLSSEFLGALAVFG